MTTATTDTSAALLPLVDALLAQPLDTLTVSELQARIVDVTPQVHRLQGWLTAAAGELDQRTGGVVPDADGCARKTSGWLADVQHTTPQVTGAQLRHRPAAARPAAGHRRRPARRPHPGAGRGPDPARRQHRRTPPWPSRNRS